MAKKFYITTTIPYTNGEPHIGFAMELIQADILARWHRQKREDVFFLTGTDEHGSKNYQTAKNQGLPPLKFVDRNSAKFRELTKVLNISNDNFIRTTDKKLHWPGVVKMWKKLAEKGDIYRKKYTGNYCSGCERFVTEKDLVNGRCPNHPDRDIEKISEENYFFKLSKYSDRIKKLIKADVLKIYPEKWKNDFLSLIKNGLTDVSFSREKSHLPWGVPVPGDGNQVMYVWCDALTNYLTGIGFPNAKYRKYWPADIHVVGKDMLRFHTGIWPGMLLSAGLPLPKEIIVHGFLTIDGKKISKSGGKTISPLELAKKYSADTMRYFLMRNIPFGDDGNFSEQALVQRHNDELANKLGNLVSRTEGLIEKFGVEEFDWKKSQEEVTISRNIALTNINLFTIKWKNLYHIGSLLQESVGKNIENFEFDKALNEIFAFIDVCNEYVQSKKIWETGDKKVLFELKESILKIAELLFPFIPESAEKIKKQFSSKKIKKGEILFEKVK